MDHFQHIVKVCTHDIHLIDVNHAGDLIMVRLAPNSLGLGLHTALGAQHSHATVQNAQGALHLNGEVHVARSVDDVDAAGLPVAGSRSGGDGDTTLLFLRHPVHGSRAFMGLTDFIVDAGIEQNTFRSRRLTSIDMGHDTDISGIFK